MKNWMNRSGAPRAFTFVELLTVMAVLALLITIAATGLCYNQAGSDRAVCAYNQRQLMQAWQMYADEHSGALMANSGTSAGYVNWVKGFLDYSPANNDNINTTNLTDPRYALMGYYVKAPAYFRCPADGSWITRNGVPIPRVRSYSMNSYVGTGAQGFSGGFQNMAQLSQITQPERTLILIEEHPDSINDGMFWFDLSATGAAARYLDIPAAFHSAGANLAMADGHVEYWQWADARSMPPVRAGYYSGIQTPNNPDVLRIQKVTSYRP